MQKQPPAYNASYPPQSPQQQQQRVGGGAAFAQPQKTPMKDYAEAPEIYSPSDFQNGELPPAKGYRDVLFTVIWLLKVFTFIALLIYFRVNYHEGSPCSQNDKRNVDEVLDRADIPFEFTATAASYLVVYAVLIPAAVGVVLALLFLAAVRKYAKELIYAGFVTNILIWVLWAVALFIFVSKQNLPVWIAFVPLIGAALVGLMWCLWRRRIPFAAAVLTTVGMSIKRLPGTLGASLLMVIVQVGWCAMWGVTAMYGAHWANYRVQEAQCNGGDGQSTFYLNYVLYVFLLLAFYWTAEVIRNTFHVTVSGAVATWYFLGGAQMQLAAVIILTAFALHLICIFCLAILMHCQMPSHPTLRSFKRAATTSFGSICLGSLVVAIVQTLKAMVRNMRNSRNGILVCILLCFISCIEWMIRYFNKYAFVIVAMYGNSFCDSAKITWELFKARGIYALVNDCLVDRVIFLLCFAGGLLCGGVGALACYIFMYNYSIYFVLIGGFVGLFVGGVVMTMAAQVVSSATATIFVAWSLDPTALERNSPELSNYLRQTESLV